MICLNDKLQLFIVPKKLTYKKNFEKIRVYFYILVYFVFWKIYNKNQFVLENNFLSYL